MTSSREQKNGDRLDGKYELEHLLGHGVHAGQLFVAMELVKGQTLGQWMASVDEPRPWREVLGVFIEAGRGLAAAHEAGLIHRDFKPDNVMLRDDGRVRVMDFGLARAEIGDSDAENSLAGLADLPVNQLTRTGAILGTPAYMSVEQFEATEVDARSDQFGFCVALYEALYGERPFAGDTIASLFRAILTGQVRPAPRGSRVPTALREVVVHGLARDRDDRHDSMFALLEALEASAAPRARRLGAWAASLVVLVGAGLASSLPTRQSRNQTGT